MDIVGVPKTLLDTAVGEAADYLGHPLERRGDVVGEAFGVPLRSGGNEAGQVIRKVPNVLSASEALGNAAADTLEPYAPRVAKAIRGGQEGLLEKTSALLTDPSMLVLPEHKLVAAAFLPGIVQGAGDELGQAGAAVERGDWEAAAKHGAGGLTDTAFALLAGHHLGSGLGVAERETPKETKATETEAAPPEQGPPPAPEAMDLELERPFIPEEKFAPPIEQQVRQAEIDRVAAQGPPSERNAPSAAEVDLEASFLPPSMVTPEQATRGPVAERGPLVGPEGLPLEPAPEAPPPFRGRVETEADIRQQILDEAKDAERTQPRLAPGPTVRMSERARATEGVESPSQPELPPEAPRPVATKIGEDSLAELKAQGRQAPQLTEGTPEPPAPEPGRRVFHLSSTEGIERLSPQEATKRAQGYSEEAARADRVPRVNLYAEGATPEARFRTRQGETRPDLTKYEGEIPAGSKIYDLEKDPDGILKSGLRGTELERAVVAKGYKGIEQGGSIAYFGEDLPVAARGRVGADAGPGAGRGSEPLVPPPAEGAPPDVASRLLEAAAADARAAEPSANRPRLRTPERTIEAQPVAAEGGAGGSLHDRINEQVHGTDVPRAKQAATDTFELRAQQTLGIRDADGKLVPREQRRLVASEVEPEEFKASMMEAARGLWGNEGQPGVSVQESPNNRDRWTLHRDANGEITSAAVVNSKGVLAYWAGEGPGTGLVIRRAIKENPGFRIPADSLSPESSRALNTVLERGGKFADRLRETLWPEGGEQRLLDTESRFQREYGNAAKPEAAPAGERAPVPVAGASESAGGPAAGDLGERGSQSGPGPETVRPEGEVAGGTVGERASRRLTAIGDAAAQRIEERASRLGRDTAAAFSTTAENLADVATYGAARIASGLVDRAQWAAHMVERFGEAIRPKLDQIWEQAHKVADFIKEQYEAQSVSTKKIGYAIRGVASRYAAANGMTDFDPRTRRVFPLDEARAKRIADAFDAMAHDPSNLAVKLSYEAMKGDVDKQWDFLKKEGYKLEAWKEEGQPYANSKEMREDVLKNKHLYFFQGGEMPQDHPLAEASGTEGLTYNDKFRAVHDVFAHAKEGFEFGAKGEENGWREHYAMMSPEARPAMTTETRGQNSWVNFGKHLRTPWGEVPKKGEEGFVPPSERPYAEQKAGLLPEDLTVSQIDTRKKTAADTAREIQVPRNGPGGTARNEDVAQALEEASRRAGQLLKTWGTLSPEETANVMARAEKHAKAEIEYQLEQPKSGVGWYRDDIAKLEEGVKKVHPELEDPKQMSLFKTLVAATSPGNKPDLNLRIASEIWDRYKKDGKFPIRQESGKEWPGAPTFGKATGGQSAAGKLQALVDKFGEEGAADWLNSSHPISELREFNKWIPGNAKTELPGFHILGEKAGPFAGNLHGKREGLTADMWFSRTWNRWMGTMFEKTPQGREIVDAPRNEAERNLMRGAVDKLSKQFGLETADTQAVLWYYEQQLWRQLGSKITEGSYADATKKLLERRGEPTQGDLFGGAERGGTAGENRQAGQPGEAPAAGEGAAVGQAGGERVPEAAGGAVEGLVQRLGQRIKEVRPNAALVKGFGDLGEEAFGKATGKPGEVEAQLDLARIMDEARDLGGLRGGNDRAVAQTAAQRIVEAVLHEAAHGPGGGHGSDFEGRLADLRQGLAGDFEKTVGEVRDALLNKGFDQTSAPDMKLSWLDSAADKAQARITERAGKLGKGEAAGGIDPQVLSDAALVGARWIRDGVKSVGEFTSKLIDQFGDSISEHAGKIWEEAQRVFSSGRGPLKPIPPPEKKGAAPKAKTEPKPVDAASKLVDLVRGAKPVTKQTEVLRSKELSRRSAEVQKILRENPGEEGFIKAKQAMSGELPKADFEPQRDKLTETEVGALFSQIQNHPKLRTFEKVRAFDALRNMLEGGRIPQRNEIALLERTFGPELPKALASHKSRGHQALSLVQEAINIPRAIMASMDLSAPFRQGLVLTVSEPRHALAAGKDMLKAAFSEKAYQQIEDQIRQSPNAELHDKFGLHLGDITSATKDARVNEEVFAGGQGAEQLFEHGAKLFEKIPVVGPVLAEIPRMAKSGIRGSNRAYTTYLAKLRSDVFDSVAGDFKKAGLTPEENPATYRDLARWVNISTGRGELGSFGERISPILGEAFFSPRLVASRFQLLNPKTYVDLDPAVRKKAISNMVALAAAGTTLVSLAAAAGADVETDPRSSDFGKIRVGRTRIDPWGGIQQWVRLYSQLASGQRKTLGGQIKELNAEGPFGESRADVALRFGRSKLSPTASIIADWLSGKDFQGRKFSVSNALQERFIPMISRDFIAAAQEHDPTTATGLAALSGVGMGISTYQPRGQEALEELPGATTELQKELVRVGKNITPPKTSLTFKTSPGGHPGQIDLNTDEQAMVTRGYEDAAKKADKFIKSGYYKNLPSDDARAAALGKIYTDMREGLRGRLYMSSDFKKRDREARRDADKAAQKMREGS